ncbi:uncharacterized protein BKA55DRAFT_583413 [Fusarium redolens]|uniref:Uncharacterized protein n=1 Tax=Fusarium redolens TaxID=48865 RepID=A0A9P9G2J2_FUSRE|nr:uncharacterized protein BKA55DRAFT_583413 [Fusarium redolens]KAH7230092.1 hypothetical protein BKA55DRAFT_583413 [Fusarium redolens]
MLYSGWFSLSTLLTAHLVSGDIPPQCYDCVVFTPDPPYAASLYLSGCSTDDCPGLAEKAQKKTGGSCISFLNIFGCNVQCSYNALPDQNSINQVRRKYC